MNGGFTMVMIGIDPHKRNHTAVAVNRCEDVLGKRLVHAGGSQVAELVAWADGLDDRQRTALHAKQLIEVRVEDHATILRLLTRRHTQLAQAHNKAACRLHALVCDLVPGGIRKEIVVRQAAELLDSITPSTRVATQRLLLARDLLADVELLEQQRRESKARITAAIAASGTTLTEIFGVGVVVAGILIGHAGNPTRFTTADRFAAYNGTAPVERSSGDPNNKIWRLSRRGNRTMNHAIHIAAVTQIRHRHSIGRAFYDRKLAEGQTPKKALRALKRRISDTIYRHLIADDAPRRTTLKRGPGRTTRKRLHKPA